VTSKDGLRTIVPSGAIRFPRMTVTSSAGRSSIGIAAPSGGARSTVDLDTPDGPAIPIEDRPADEVTVIRGIRIAPEGTIVRNPSFDVTPAELISAIVTEEGALVAPFGPALREAMARRDARRAATAVAAMADSAAAAPAAPATA
jgi:hypothetical protein